MGFPVMFAWKQATSGHSTYFCGASKYSTDGNSSADMTLWFEACEIQGSKSIAFESPGHFVKRSEFSLLVHDFLNKEDVFLSNFVLFF